MEHLPEPLFDILRAYAALYPPRLLEFPTQLPFYQVHGFLLNTVLLNPHFQAYPPSSQFQASFWKWAIDHLERYDEEDIEIDERLYAHHIALMSESSSTGIGSALPAESYATYLWKASRSANGAVYPGYENATLFESRTMIESGTTGYKTWTASLVLAELLIAFPELVRERRVLELGAGSGFLGIAAATLQSQSDGSAALWLTDLTENVLQRCSRNLSLPCNTSSQNPNIKCRALDWLDALDCTRESVLQSFLQEADPDVILGADIVYEPSIIPALVAMLRAAVQLYTKKTVAAYIALTVRNQSTYDAFLAEAERFLSVQEVPNTSPQDIGLLTPHVESRRSGMSVMQEVKILKIKRKDASLQ